MDANLFITFFALPPSIDRMLKFVTDNVILSKYSLGSWMDLKASLGTVVKKICLPLLGINPWSSRT
jgi:hypothetical protein